MGRTPRSTEIENEEDSSEISESEISEGTATTNQDSFTEFVHAEIWRFHCNYDVTVGEVYQDKTPIWYVNVNVEVTNFSNLVLFFVTHKTIMKVINFEQKRHIIAQIAKYQ